VSFTTLQWSYLFSLLHTTDSVDSIV